MCNVYVNPLQVSTKGAPTLWQSTQADNMLHVSDMKLLAYSWDMMKLDRIGESCKEICQEVFKDWAAAMDLALWCLQGVAARRPCMEMVFKHKLFDLAGELRFLQSPEELWGDFVQRQARALHAAIDQKDSTAVQELFSLGGVHTDMVYSADGSPIRPLHRAAFTGDAEVMRILMDEIQDSAPSDVKSNLLDHRTALEYTPYLIACKCGHMLVAHMLEAKGCDMTLTNSSQKTGKKLADAFWRELELSCVHPWSRGDQLHLVATNLESFLSVAEYDLNEHVHSGMQVWNSKQMVWKFDKEQMQALQAAVKQLVCTCTRAYAHSPRRIICISNTCTQACTSP